MRRAVKDGEKRSECVESREERGARREMDEVAVEVRVVMMRFGVGGVKDCRVGRYKGQGRRSSRRDLGWRLFRSGRRLPDSGPPTFPNTGISTSKYLYHIIQV